MTQPVRKRPARRRRDGYTMIEVVMAIGVLTAGAVGIMALQQATTRGNLEARQMMVGTQLTQRWMERLRRDRLNWITSSTTVPVPANILSSTTYLKNVTAAGASPAWFVPAVNGTETPNFDFYGQDTTDTGQMRYCTNVRLEWVYPGRAMRADVRVWWVRRVTGAQSDSSAAALQGCPATNLAALTGDIRLRMAYASTIIRYTASR